MLPVNILPALRHELEQSGNVSCVVDADLHLVYCNPAWDKFALDNDGSGAVASRVAGSSLRSVIPEPLKRLYDQLFAVARDSRLMWPLDYECSSAELYRLFRMEIRPMRPPGGFVIVHALRVERPHSSDRASFSPNAERYCGLRGLITMCAHCRKARRVAEPEIWDWVPEYVAAGAPREKISHGICGPCLAYFYPQAWKVKARAANR